MRSRGLFVAALIAAGLGLLLVRSGLAKEKPVVVEAAKPKVHQIALIQSLFRGNEAGALFAQSAPFADLMNVQTGMRGQFTVLGDSQEIAKKLMKDELQLAVLHGIEYAWIMKQFPELQPLVIPYNTSPKLRALLLVPEAAEVKSITGLKGKPFALPKKSLNHCHLYLHKLIKDSGHDPAGFFAESAQPINVTDAIESVIDGSAAAVIVDEVAFAAYARLKPGRAKRLRVLYESPVFPTAAIIYRPTNENREMAKKFQEGLLTAHEKPVGKQMLMLWRLTQFGEVTPEYLAMLEDILKLYPEPIQPANFFPTAEAKKSE
jgi:ABC-type phosphate/phosphonate transport system substrate-binding protein